MSQKMTARKGTYRRVPSLTLSAFVNLMAGKPNQHVRIEEPYDTLDVALCFQHYRAEACEDLIHALSTTTRRVEIARVWFYPSNFYWNDHDSLEHRQRLERFADSVGNLPSLRVIQFVCQAGDHGQRRGPPLSLVSRILRKARGLQRLLFDQFLFDGTGQDFQGFGAALSTFPGRVLHIQKSCNIAPGKVTSFNINSILHAVSTLRELRQLNLGCWIDPAQQPNGSYPPVVLPMLRQVLGLPHLHQFTIHDGVPKLTAPLASVIQYYGRNLQCLIIHTRINRAHDLQQLARIIRGNSVIITIQLLLHGPHSDETTECHMLPIVSALGKNATLKSFQVKFLRETSRLSPFSSDLMEQFAYVLETKNMCLIKLTVDIYSGSYTERRGYIMKRIELYCKLNALGRMDHFKQPTCSRGAWIAKLNDCKGDVSCLYYFLAMNPSLVKNHGISAETHQDSNFLNKRVSARELTTAADVEGARKSRKLS